MAQLVIVALCLGFSSCGSDGEDQVDTQPPYGQGGTGTDTDGSQDSEGNDDEGDAGVVPTTANYVLAAAIEKTRYPSGSTVTSNRFSTPVYEINEWSGRTVLKSYGTYSESRTFEFVYDLPDGVMRRWSLYDSEYTLENSLISEGRLETGERETYEYDSRNRLVSVTVRFGSHEEITRFTYDDKYNITGYEIYGDGELTSKGEVEYTSVPAKTFPLQCLNGNLFGVFDNCAFLESGLYGNTMPLYLIRKVTKTSFIGSGEISETEYEYTLDDNGYVSAMTGRWYSNSGTYIYEWNFEWQRVSTPSYTNWLFSDIGSPYYRYLHNL